MTMTAINSHVFLLSCEGDMIGVYTSFDHADAAARRLVFQGGDWEETDTGHWNAGCFAIERRALNTTPLGGPLPTPKGYRRVRLGIGPETAWGGTSDRLIAHVVDVIDEDLIRMKGDYFLMSFVEVDIPERSHDD